MVLGSFVRLPVPLGLDTVPPVEVASVVPDVGDKDTPELNPDGIEELSELMTGVTETVELSSDPLVADTVVPVELTSVALEIGVVDAIELSPDDSEELLGVTIEIMETEEL